MKKHVLLTILACFGLISVYGQGSIRSLNPPFSDGTYRGLSQTQNATPSVNISTDTISVYPNAFYTYVQPNDSVVNNLYYIEQVLPGNFTGDEMKFYGLAAATSTGSGTAKTLNFRNKYHTVFKFSTAADSTISLTAKKHYVVTFLWDGTYWLETGKSIGQ